MAAPSIRFDQLALPARSERQWRCRLAAIAGLLLALCALRVDSADLRMDALDQPAPVVGLGNGTTLMDLHGQWVLLHFWATWCDSCVTELPALDQLARRWGDRIRFFAVSIDEGDPKTVDDFIARNNLTIAIVHRQDARASERYLAWGVPVTYLINPQGRLVGRILGPRDWTAADIDAVLGRLLQEAGGNLDVAGP